LTGLPHPAPPPEALSLRGLRAVGGMAAPVLALERLDALARAAPEHAGAIALTPQLLANLGWKQGQAEAILRALGFAPAHRNEDESNLWRRRASAAKAAPAGPAVSPFAALAPLVKPATSPARRTRRMRRRRRAASGGGAS
jgi:ATP-dependent RNA helicase SUPV3L1/SUV3